MWLESNWLFQHFGFQIHHFLQNCIKAMVKDSQMGTTLSRENLEMFKKNSLTRKEVQDIDSLLHRLGLPMMSEFRIWNDYIFAISKFVLDIRYPWIIVNLWRNPTQQFLPLVLFGNCHWLNTRVPQTNPFLRITGVQLSRIKTQKCLTFIHLFILATIKDDR